MTPEPTPQWLLDLAHTLTELGRRWPNGYRIIHHCDTCHSVLPKDVAIDGEAFCDPCARSRLTTVRLPPE